MPGQRYSNQSFYRVPMEAPDAMPGPEDGPVAPVTPQRYRRNAPAIGLVATLLGVLVVISIVAVGIRPPGGTDSATKSPSPSATETPGYTPSPNWQGIEFTASGYQASGYWQVGPPIWDGDTVTVTTTLTVDKGTMRFSFFALDNQATNYYEPIGGSMSTGSVSEGDSQTGTVVLNLPRGDFTFYLATARGTQVTALIISG